MKAVFILPCLLSCGLLAAQNTQPRDSISGGTINESMIQADRQSLTGLTRIDSRFVRTLPAFMGENDVLKAVQFIPGISGGKEGNVGVMIRGGNYDQTEFLFDGAQVFSPAHLRGFVSAYNPDVVESVDVYKGALPASFGGRLSGVVDVRARDGDFSRFHAGLTVGMLSAKVYAEGPIVRDRLSFLLAARKSYTGLVMYPIYKKIADEANYLESFDNLDYYDLNAKLTYKPGDRDRLYVSFFMGGDDMDLSHNQLEGSSNVTQLLTGSSVERKAYSLDSRATQSWGNLMASGVWEHSFRNRAEFKAELSYSRFLNLYENKSVIDYVSYGRPDGSDGDLVKVGDGTETKTSTRRNIIEDKTASLSYSLPFRSGRLAVGAAFSLQTPGLEIGSDTDADMTLYYPSQRDSTYGGHSLTRNNPDMRSVRFYADASTAVTKSLTLRAGLRGQLWSVEGKSYFCPEARLGLTWAVSDRLRLSAGYNRTSQALHQLTSANIVTPSDIWVPITENIAPMTSDHFFAEAALTIPAGGNPVEVSVQGYYKTMDNLVEYKEQASLSDAMRWEEFVCLGTGKAYGAELLVTRDFGKLSGTLSYAWGKSLRQFDEVNEGREFYAANDRRNDIKILLTYAFSDRFDVSAAFSYHTGDRFTLAHYTGLGNIWFLQDPSADSFGTSTKYTESLSIGAIDVPVYRDRNNYRLKDYHRLDVGMNYHIFHRRAESIVSLSVYNCYNRMNPYTLQYGYDENRELGLYNVCIMPLMPALSYTIRF